jgi:hypothetical protein
MGNTPSQAKIERKERKRSVFEEKKLAKKFREGAVLLA